MEILNNIWMALSTPNADLANIIVLIGGFIEYFLFMKVFLCMLEISPTKKQQIICVLCISFISIFAMHILSSPFNILLNYLLTIIIAFIIFKTSLLKSSICIILSGILFNVVGTLLLNPYITIFHITTDDLLQIPFYRLIYISLMYSTIFIIYLILKSRNLKLNFILDVIFC